MLVPLTTQDFLARGATVYPDRVAVVDEPEQPAGSVGEITFAEVQARARAVAAGLDAMGVAAGERIAVVSQNSARMLDLFYGATASGRIVVPINFRLGRDEVDYIVDHSEASLLLVDPELELPLAGLRAPRRLTLGSRVRRRAAALRRRAAAMGRTSTRTRPRRSTTRAERRRARRASSCTHRNIWLNATVMALHLGVTDRDVYLHSVPMFHVNGWSLPFSLAALGVPQVVLRKVDGPEILRRIDRHGVTLLGGAPAVLDIALDGRLPEHRPERSRVRIVRGGAPPPTRTIARVEQELGWEVIQIYGLTETSPLLVINRARAEDVAAGDDERHRRLTRAGAPALGVDACAWPPDGEILARSNHVLKGYWRQPDATARGARGRLAAHRRRRPAPGRLSEASTTARRT